MKFNIGMEDAKFIVNKEKKTVVCVLEHTENLFIDFININAHINTSCDARYERINHNKYESVLHNRLKMPNKFVGIAHCSEDDVWDEHIGRAIAFTRAKDNLLKAFFKRAQIYINAIDEWVGEATDIINALGDKLTRNTERRHAYIESLIGNPDGNENNN